MYIVQFNSMERNVTREINTALPNRCFKSRPASHHISHNLKTNTVYGINAVLSFIFCRTPEQCPSVVSLLAESYNPHVRYGAAMALGIACAGTGLREAIALLEPMVKFDPVNFVRQGALVGVVASSIIIINWMLAIIYLRSFEKWTQSVPLPIRLILSDLF